MSESVKIHPEAQLNLRLIDEYDNASRKKWVKQAAEDYQFALNEQWTKEEIRELEARGQFPLVVPRVFPILKQKEGQLTANKPKFIVAPAESGDVNVARMINQIFDYIWSISDGNSVLGRAVQDSLFKGLGYLYAYFDKYEDSGRGEIKIDYLRPEDVFVDPNSRRKDFSDSDHILVKKELTVQQVKKKFPDIAARLLKQAPQGTGEHELAGTYTSKLEEPIFPSDVYNHEDKYRLIERYTKVRIKQFVVQTETGIEVLTEEEANALISTGEISPDALAPAYVYRVRVVCTLEGELVYDITLPISELPIVPIPNEYTGTPYPMSDVRFLRGMQREVNKRRSLMIAHATVSTNPRLMVEEGSIPKDQDIEREWARPASVIRYFPGKQPPQQYPPVPLPSALYQLEAEAKYDMEYTAGIFALSQGSSREAPETFRATLAIEEFGNRRIQLTARNINRAVAKLGKVLLEMIQAYYDYEKTFRILQDDGNVSEFTINKLVKDDYTGEIKRLYDITTGKYDVYFIAGSTLATNRTALLDLMIKLYQMGIVDDVEVLKNLDNVDINKLIERKSMLAQTTQQLQQLQNQMQDLLQTVEKLQAENMDLQKQIEIERFRAQLQREVDNLRLTNEATRQKMNLSIESLKQADKLQRQQASKSSTQTK